MSRAASWAQACRRSVGAPRRADERGVLTLEWLILVSLVTLVGAISTVTIARALGESLGRDESTEPSVRVHEADIQATGIETAAHAALTASQRTGGPSYDDDTFKSQCEQRLPARHGDVVASATWTAPTLAADGSDDADTRARCVLTLR